MPLPAACSACTAAARGVLELVAPQRCLSCLARGSVPWCRPCAAEVRELPVGCPRCAAPAGGTHACWPSDAPIAATVARYDYRGPVADAVVAAKLGGARAAWPTLAALLAERVAAAGFAVDVVTWITTPRTRVRARGSDHAEALARGAAHALHLPAARLLEAAAVEEGRDRYRSTATLPGSRVLLVDDVVTTGSTGWRAADALVRAGADPVTLAVLARAGSHPLGAARPARAGERAHRRRRRWVRPPS